LQDFREMLSERQGFVNKVMEDLNLSNVHPLLEVPTKYAILSGGKRLRPLICMLSPR
jgi:geranylgeranyl pyrophosphate synthase